MYDKGHAAADLEDPLICFKVLKKNAGTNLTYEMLNIKQLRPLNV